MPGTLRVIWTIRTSTTIPKPILRCSRCDQPKPFAPSGKFRLNANGKRLDAWLVYRCETCGASWNRTIFERRRRSEIDAATFEALQGNDPALAGLIARDFAGLGRWTRRFADAADGALAVDRTVIEGRPAETKRLEIRLSVATGATHRCDRVLVAGLGISRNRVAVLAAEGRLQIDDVSKRPVARALHSGSLLKLTLDGLADARALARGAAGMAAEEPGPMRAD
jgi:hypothetical protein